MDAGELGSMANQLAKALLVRCNRYSRKPVPETVGIHVSVGARVENCINVMEQLFRRGADTEAGETIKEVARQVGDTTI